MLAGTIADHALIGRSVNDVTVLARRNACRSPAAQDDAILPFRRLLRLAIR
jgi:hypothetical protein